MRANALDVSICQEALVEFAIKLRCCSLFQVSVLVELEEDVLSDAATESKREQISLIHL